jgi:hypothetical protein
VCLGPRAIGENPSVVITHAFLSYFRMHVKHFVKDWNHSKLRTQEANGQTGWRQLIVNESVFQLLDSTGVEYCLMIYQSLNHISSLKFLQIQFLSRPFMVFLNSSRQICLELLHSQSTNNNRPSFSHLRVYNIGNS